MITPLPWLERVPTYKEQIENLKERDLGTYGFLGYPLLQSADIVMYGEPGSNCSCLLAKTRSRTSNSRAKLSAASTLPSFEIKEQPSEEQMKELRDAFESKIGDRRWQRPN